jgi:hypothetical protein
MTEEIAYISMVLLFGGISLLLFYFIVRKQGESRQNQ